MGDVGSHANAPRGRTGDAISVGGRARKSHRHRDMQGVTNDAKTTESATKNVRQPQKKLKSPNVPNALELSCPDASMLGVNEIDKFACRAP